MLAAAPFAVSGNANFRPESAAGSIVRFLIDIPPDEAHDLVVGALEKAGHDGHDHVHVNLTPA
jgi:hypothetical protein